MWSYMGQHTMPILILHFLAFKLVTALGIILGYGDNTNLSAHPVAYFGFGWCLAYIFVGVVIPLALNAGWWHIYGRLKDFVMACGLFRKELK